MARLGRSYPQQPRIPRVPPAPPSAPASASAGTAAQPVATKQARSATPPPGDYASGAGWALAGQFCAGYPGAPDPQGPAGGTQAQPAGVKHASGSASIAAGGVVLETGTVNGPAIMPGGTTATAAGVKHATGSVIFAATSPFLGAGTKTATSGTTTRAGGRAIPAGAKGASGAAPLAAGTAQAAQGTHQGAGTASVRGGTAMAPVIVPGASSSLLESFAWLTRGTKAVTGSAAVMATTALGGPGRKTATSGTTAQAGGKTTPATTKQAQAPASSRAGTRQVTPGTKIASSSAAAAAGTRHDAVSSVNYPASLTDALIFQVGGSKNASGAVTFNSGSALGGAGTKAARSTAASPAGAAVQAPGTKQALSAPSAPGNYASGAGWATAGQFSAGFPGAPDPQGPQGGTALTPAGLKGASSAVIVPAGSAVLAPGGTGSPASLLGGAVITATGHKNATGAPKTPGSLAAAPLGAKGASGAVTARNGAAAVPAGAKGASGAVTAAAGGKQATPGTKTASAAAIVPAGTQHRTGATGTSTPAAITGGALTAPIGRKTARGSAAIRGGLAAVPVGDKGTRGSIRLAGGATSLVSGTHAASIAAIVRAGGKTAPVGAKQATGASAVYSGAGVVPLALGVQLVNTWTASYTAPLAPAGPALPGAASVPVTVANTAGNWLFCVVGWRQAPGYPPVTWHVGDGTNFWEPMGAPGGTSPPSGTLRIAVWRAPAARAVTAVNAAPTGFCLSACVAVLEMSGLFPWVAEAGCVTAFASNVTTLPALTPPTPATPVLWVTASVRSLSAPTGTYPAGNWQAGPAAATGNGLDHTGDLVLLTAFQQGNGSVTATWSQSAASDMAGIAAGVEIFAAPPPQPNPAWAPGIFEIAPGAGAATPADELTWVPVDGTEINGLTVPARMQDISWTQGQQYTVGALQAGEGSVTLDNRDLALTPPGLGAFAGIDSGVPWRYRVTWPGTPAAPNLTPHYILTGTTLDLPASWNTTRRGVVRVGLTDAWAQCQPQIQSSLRQEMLADSPVHLWPCGDTAGSVYASNLAPGSTAALALVTSKYGSAGATSDFGATTALSALQVAVAPGGSGGSGLPGDGGTVWAQTGLPSAPTPGGFCLYCQASDFPPLNGPDGYTIECWTALTDTALQQNGTLWAIKGSKGLVMRCYADLTGALWLTTQDIAGTQVTTSLGPTAYAGAGMFQTAVTWNAGVGWTAYVNGAAVAESGSAPNLPPSYAWVTAGGESDRFTSGGMFDGQTAFLADFPQALTPSRVAAHWQAGSIAFQAETDYGRIERLLSYAGYTGRRVIGRAEPADLVASLADLGGSQASGRGADGGKPTPAGSGTVQAGGEIAATVASLTPAMLTVASTGDIVYSPKASQFGQPVTWALGENADAGEIPYEWDVNFGWDPQRVLNFIQITQVDRQDTVIPQAFVPLAPGYTLPAQSQQKYAQQTYQINGYLWADLTTPISSPNPSNLLDLANWISVTLAAPHLRAGKVTIEASAKTLSAPGAWPLVLGAQPGDIALVGRRPITASTAISLLARVMRIERQITWIQGGAKATAVLTLDYCPEASPLSLDDPVLGQIGVPVTGQAGLSPVLTW